jgi:membrane protein DedA with SNARE-associated domain
MTGLDQYLAAVEPYLREYGYAAVFADIFLESFGLPPPGETMLIAGALLASQGDMHILPLLGTIWLAAVLGDNLGYAIGFFGGRRVLERYGPYVGVTELRLKKVEAVFRQYGGGIVIVARFFILLRQLNGLVAGTAAMPFRRFVVYNALGAGLWTAAWGLGVYYLGQQIPSAFSWLPRFGSGALVVAWAAVVALLLLWLFRYRHRH